MCGTEVRGVQGKLSGVEQPAARTMSGAALMDGMNGAHVLDLEVLVKQDLARYAVCRGSRVEDAEDIVQEAICRALVHFDRSSGSPLEAWVKLVIRRLVIDHRRSEATEKRLASKLPRQVVFDPCDDVVDRALARYADVLLDQLPIAQRDILIAIYDGESVAQIASRMGRSVRSVEGHLRRARSNLRILLSSCYLML